MSMQGKDRSTTEISGAGAFERRTSDRSADLQSAVSQNCILRDLANPTSDLAIQRVFKNRAPADCKSAIQQITNLRYVRAGPEAGAPQARLACRDADFKTMLQRDSGFFPMLKPVGVDGVYLAVVGGRNCSHRAAGMDPGSCAEPRKQYGALAAVLA